MSAVLEIQTNDPALMQQFVTDLQTALNQAGSSEELSVETRTDNTDVAKSGDLTTLLTVAVGTGGALTVLLSKDSILESFARLLEKYIESRQLTVSYKKAQGEHSESIDISGSAKEIKDVLKTLKD
jgi:capsid portal protein